MEIDGYCLSCVPMGHITNGIVNENTNLAYALDYIYGYYIGSEGNWITSSSSMTSYLIPKGKNNLLYWKLNANRSTTNWIVVQFNKDKEIIKNERISIEPSDARKEWSVSLLDETVYISFGFHIEDYQNGNLFFTLKHSMLSNKTISLLGDSVTTYSQPWIPSGYATWYNSSKIGSPYNTYWGKMLASDGAKLLQNNSWSGSWLAYNGSNAHN